MAGVFANCPGWYDKGVEIVLKTQNFESSAIKEVEFPRQAENVIEVARVPSILELSPIGLNMNVQRNVAVVRSIKGDILSKFMRTTNAPTQTLLSSHVSAFGYPLQNIPVTFYDLTANKKISTKATDSRGYTTQNITYPTPTKKIIVSFIGEEYTPIVEVIPGLSAKTVLSVWLIKLVSKNISDTWMRLQGRALGHELNRLFWREQPWTTIGLAGWLEFIELIPVVSGQTIRYEVGVSAWCNTPEPFPPKEKCEEYRKNTWWQFDLYASNSPSEPKHVGGGKINIDSHLVYELTANSVRFVERRSVA